MTVLESDGHGCVDNYPDLMSQTCHACESRFTQSDGFESLVERVSKRWYLIHSECYELLKNRLKGEWNGNFPTWYRV